MRRRFRPAEFELTEEQEAWPNWMIQHEVEQVRWSSCVRQSTLVVSLAQPLPPNPEKPPFDGTPPAFRKLISVFGLTLAGQCGHKNAPLNQRFSERGPVLRCF